MLSLLIIFIKKSDRVLIAVVVTADGLKILFCCSAKGANPIDRKILKVRSLGNAVVGIADLRIIFIAAKCTNVKHKSFLLQKCNY